MVDFYKAKQDLVLARTADFKKLLDFYKIEVVNEKWARCVFHSPDNHPSLNFDWERGLFCCFSCKAGGDIIDFVKLYEKLDFNNAIQRLLPFTSNREIPILEINKDDIVNITTTKILDLLGSKVQAIREYYIKENNYEGFRVLCSQLESIEFLAREFLSVAESLGDECRKTRLLQHVYSFVVREVNKIFTKV